MSIRRFYNLSDFIDSGKVLVIYGARRVGKTTLIRNYLQNSSYKFRLETGDNLQIHDILGSQDINKISDFVEGYELIVIDEAQNIPNIEIGLKIIVDHFPDIKVIVTGSASFELAGQIGEPLTGRKTTLTLYPISQLELKNKLKNSYDLSQNLEDYLIFGSYPNVITAKSNEDKIAFLDELVGSYLLKDILALENIKNSKVLVDLLRLLAYQIGSEVSQSELAQNLGVDQKTVGKYLDLLEKSFIIKSLNGFSRNLRSEIAKKSKYYFYDNGIRDMLISNFNKLEIRNDIGQLWENFLFIERIKKRKYERIYANNYFWRTYEQKEIDLIEEREGKLFAYEFKFTSKDAKAPKQFKENYPESLFEEISKENYLDFIC